MAKAKPLLEELAAHDAVRNQRASDRQIESLKRKLADANQRLKQAEEDLEKAESRVDFIRSLADPSIEQYDRKPLKPGGQATALILLSDWHVEETVDPETINGLNEYNLEIAERRIRQMFENSVSLIEAARNKSNIKDLVVAVLGDMINGYIHDENKETNSLSPTEASLFVQDHLASGLEFLKKHSGCKSILVPAVSGNHGRTTKEQRSGTEYRNSYEWLLYKQMERYYRNDPKVTWLVGKSKQAWLTIQDRACRFSHGHAFKYNGGVGGCFVPIRGKLAKFDKVRKSWHDYFGHLHTHLKDTKWTMNNCLIGYNSYAQDIGADYTPPSQTLVVIDRKRSVPVVTAEIFCEEENPIALAEASCT